MIKGVRNVVLGLVIAGGMAFYVPSHTNILQSRQNNPQVTPTIASQSAQMTPIASESAQIATPSATTACTATQLNKNDAQSFIPDPKCTPGTTNPAVTQANIDQTICVSGYTGTIRPPVSYTNNLKTQQMAQYGFTGPRSTYEEDHFISLELGGNPTDPKNLWPEPGASPNEKDKVENYLHKQVCAGLMPLSQAQKEITTEWYTIYQTL